MVIYTPKEAHSRIFVTRGSVAQYSRDKYWPKKAFLGAASLYHTVSALLDAHPTYIDLDVSLDVKNAFTFLSNTREAFMPLVRTHLPDRLPWIDSMYGSTTNLFFGDLSHPELPSTIILSQRCTRQAVP